MSLLERLSDLQLGDEKVTLNHLDVDHFNRTLQAFMNFNSHNLSYSFMIRFLILTIHFFGNFLGIIPQQYVFSETKLSTILHPPFWWRLKSPITWGWSWIWGWSVFVNLQLLLQWKHSLPFSLPTSGFVFFPLDPGAIRSHGCKQVLLRKCVVRFFSRLTFFKKQHVVVRYLQSSPCAFFPIGGFLCRNWELLMAAWE